MVATKNSHEKMGMKKLKGEFGREKIMGVKKWVRKHGLENEGAKIFLQGANRCERHEGRERREIYQHP